MARRRSRSRAARIPREEALRRLRILLDRVREAIDARRAFSCEGCDAPCCRVGRNGMLATPLEAAAAAERVLGDPALHDRIDEIERRVKDTARRLRVEATGPLPPTYDCPFLSEEGHCLVHGDGQPLGCITYTTLADGGCDPDVEVFEDAFEDLMRLNREWLGRGDPDGELLPLAVERALRRR